MSRLLDMTVFPEFGVIEVMHPFVQKVSMSRQCETRDDTKILDLQRNLGISHMPSIPIMGGWMSIGSNRFTQTTWVRAYIG